MPTLELAVDALEAAHKILTNVPKGAVVVFDFHEAPEELQAYSSNGGDEDHILVHSTPDVQWSPLLAVCCEDTYFFGCVDGMDCYITITAHA